MPPPRNYKIWSAFSYNFKSALTIRKWLKKILNESKAIRTDIDKLREHTRENYMSTLRLTIMSEEIPLEERLEAGEKYVQLGGNGPVKCKYKELQEAYLKKSRREG